MTKIYTCLQFLNRSHSSKKIKRILISRGGGSWSVVRSQRTVGTTERLCTCATGATIPILGFA